MTLPTLQSSISVIALNKFNNVINSQPAVHYGQLWNEGMFQWRKGNSLRANCPGGICQGKFTNPHKTRTSLSQTRYAQYHTEHRNV